MVTLHTVRVGTERALVDRIELERLVEIARRVEAVELVEVTDEIPVEGLMRLAQEGGSFDLLADAREDVYSREDLKVRYRCPGEESSCPPSPSPTSRGPRSAPPWSCPAPAAPAAT